MKFPKRRLMLVLSLMFLPAVFAAENLLEDPGFQKRVGETFAAWHTDPKAPMKIAGAVSPDGIPAVVLTETPTDARLWQNIACVPGVKYELSCVAQPVGDRKLARALLAVGKKHIVLRSGRNVLGITAEPQQRSLRVALVTVGKKPGRQILLSDLRLEKVAAFGPDTCVDGIRPKGKTSGERISSLPVSIFQYPAEFDAARVERVKDGFRLKKGVRSNVGDPFAKPDIRFRKVAFPQNAVYLFRITSAGPRDTTDCRVMFPDILPTRLKFRRDTEANGVSRELGYFTIRKGEHEIGFVLPEGQTLTSFTFNWFGPRPLPPEMRDYRPPFTPHGRPRLLLNAERLSALRRTKAHPDLTRSLEILKAQANSPLMLVEHSGCEVVYQPALQQKLIAAAFFALLNDDKDLARKTVKEMHRYFTRLYGFPQLDTYYNLRDATMAAAFVYDWCYSAFTPQERKEMIAAFYRLAARQETGWPPLRGQITNGHPNELAPAYVSFGIACYDEDPEPYRIISYQVFEQLMPLRKYENRSPVHPQGVSYGGARLRADYFFAAAYRIACGKDIFGTDTWRVPFYWQMLRLSDTYYFKEGDMWGFTRPPTAFGEILLLACAANRDPTFKGMYRAIDGDRDNPLCHVLFYDAELPEVKPADARHPQAFYFGPYHGSMIARTGWWNDEAAAYWMGGGKHNGPHQHYDAGAFQIWYRGFLAADIGEYQSSFGNPYDFNINKRSIAHNMLRVYDPEEKFSGGGKEYDNDGGSRLVRLGARSVREYENVPESDYGSTQSVSIGPDKNRPRYSFMAADLTNAYSKKIKKYLRFFVFLDQNERDRPATFLTLDLVESAKSEFPKLIQISTYEPPVLKKNFIGLATAKGGRADVDIFLPKKAKITDYANEQSAYNPFMNKSYTPPYPHTPASRAHRIEIAPETRQAFDTFLTHFGIRDSRAKPLAASYTELENAHLVQSGGFLVTLPKKAELVNTPLVFDVPQGGTPVLCTYLAPGKWHAAGYNFTVKEGENTLFLAAPAGKLEVAPGELAGRPEYAVPAELSPPAPKMGARIELDSKRLDAVPVFADDLAWVPVAAFPNAPKFTEGKDEITFNGVTVKLPAAPRRIDGELYVPVHPLAGMLHMRAWTDRVTERVLLTSLPPDVPGVIEVRTETNADILHGRIDKDATVETSPWWLVSNPFEFTLTLDRVYTLGAVEFTFALGRKAELFPLTIEASTDGKTFHKVASGSGDPANIGFVLKWKPEKLRYLRVSGGQAGKLGRIVKLSFPR